jgi:glutamate decarboxylase
MPPGLEHQSVLRIVVRNGFSRDLAELLLRDLDRVSDRLARHGGAPPDDERVSFHH